MIDKRPIGDSGISVAPLALGGNVFDWTADEAASFAVLDAFVDAGGMMIDTADVYSAWVPGHKGGESEALIGRWLKRDPGKREKVVIATKVGFSAGLAPESIGPACDASLERLGVETIDLYYQHKDDEDVPLAASLGEFEVPARAGQDPSDRHFQLHRGPRRRSRRDGAALRLHAASRAPAVVQYGRARSVRGRAARRGDPQRARRLPLLQPRQRLPDRQVPHQGRRFEERSRRPDRAIPRRQWDREC